LRKRLLINKIIFFTSLVSYLSIFIPPDRFWLAGFFALFIPIFLIAHVFFLAYWILYKRYNYSIYSLLGLLSAFTLILRTFNWNVSDTEVSNFSVLSYNAKIFNAYQSDAEGKATQDIVQWLSKDESDLKCFQEFYHWQDSKILNTLDHLGQKGNYHAHFQRAYTNDVGGLVGMAIFSKHPILKRGSLKVRDKYKYGAIYVDLLFKKDTIRVYNIHLKSMSIDTEALKDTDNLKKNYFDLFRRLKNGFAERAKQVKIIREDIEKCPYKVILCGDLNDLPYSYTYHQLSQVLENAFEQGGKGFGFTFNSWLFFLRIDNQFFSEKIKIKDCQTFRDIGYSDHFPIKANYWIE
jgi:endonuclease/exonuclease/phosphatase family metal-dependent hydrolase